MHCTYHPRVEATGTCRGCRKPLCADCTDANGYCTVCAAGAAAEDFRQVDQARVAGLQEREGKSKRMARLRIAALWGLLGLCAAVAAWQLPAAVSSFKADKPLRVGTYRTDAATDACIANLWMISRLLQEGKTPTGALACPASGRAYVPHTGAEGVVYHCPQPGRHGLRSLSVSRSKPVPEALK